LPQDVLSASPRNLTAPGAVLGTVSYMSPEQARGESPDGRTDLFSLGVILHEMVAGERPSAGAAAANRIPKPLQRIIRKTLAPDRDQRYSSAAELLEALTAVKRRLESRTARRLINGLALAAAAAVALMALGASLSITETWQERVLRDGHTAAVRQVVFSPDG